MLTDWMSFSGFRLILQINGSTKIVTHYPNFSPEWEKCSKRIHLRRQCLWQAKCPVLIFSPYHLIAVYKFGFFLVN